MKKIYFTILISCILFTSSFAQTASGTANLTLIDVANELVLPQKAYYGATAASRAPLATRLTLTGLAASTTYRYITGISSTDNISTAAFAPGSFFRVNNGTPGVSGSITGYTTQKFALNGSELSGDQIQFGPTNYHARFTTDASGNYTGWFIVVPTGNAQQAINSNVYFYVHLCLNSAPTGNPALSYRTTSTIQLLDYTTDNTGLSPLVGTSSSIGDEKIVLLYDNIAGTGRPLSTTYTENEGLNITGFSTWYTGNVEGVSGKWGAVVPNNTAIRAIKFFNANDGSEIVVGNGTGNTSADGTWNGISTIINTGSTATPVTINSIAPTTLPISLTSFSGEAKDYGVRLNWVTAQESNNQYFELFRAGEDKNFVSVGKVNGAVNSTETKTYSFDDISPLSGTNYYQLKQVDLDGKSETFSPIAVKFGLSKDAFKVLSASESSVVVSISSAVAKQGTISYIGLDGRVLYKQQVAIESGQNSFTIPVDKSTGRIGVINFSSGNEQQSLKVSR